MRSEEVKGICVTWSSRSLMRKGVIAYKVNRVQTDILFKDLV